MVWFTSMLVSALCIVVSELIVTQLVVDRIECSFSPNLNDAVVMPYDTRKVQRINYNSLHNTGTTGALNSSSEEDIHSSGLFSTLGSLRKVTSSRPISLLSSTYFPVKSDMDEVEEIVSDVLDSYDEKDEKIEAELALVFKEEEQLKREKAELEELKKHDEAVGGMVKGKKGDKKEKEKTSQKKKDSETILHVVVIGKSGTGKSATCNTLLGSNGFESKFSNTPTTQSCKSAKSFIDDIKRNIMIIDTPGIFNVEEDTDAINAEMKRCIELSRPGFNAILMVISLSERFTSEDKEILKQYKHYFGIGIMRYVIVVFTNADRLEGSIDAYVANAPLSLTMFLKSCGNRYFAIENKKSDNEGKEKQRKGLLSTIMKLVQQNEECIYTDYNVGVSRENTEDVIRDKLRKEMQLEFDRLEKMWKKKTENNESKRESKSRSKNESIVGKGRNALRQETPSGKGRNALRQKKQADSPETTTLEQKSCEICSSNYDKKTMKKDVYWCQECEMCFCIDCFKLHKRQKSSRKHEMVQL